MHIGTILPCSSQPAAAASPATLAPIAAPSAVSAPGPAGKQRLLASFEMRAEALRKELAATEGVALGTCDKARLAEDVGPSEQPAQKAFAAPARSMVRQVARKQTHLPCLCVLADADASLIFVTAGGFHSILPSHSCARAPAGASCLWHQYRRCASPCPKISSECKKRRNR